MRNMWMMTDLILKTVVRTRMDRKKIHVRAIPYSVCNTSRRLSTKITGKATQLTTLSWTSTELFARDNFVTRYTTAILNLTIAYRKLRAVILKDSIEICNHKNFSWIVSLSGIFVSDTQTISNAVIIISIYSTVISFSTHANVPAERKGLEDFYMTRKTFFFGFSLDSTFLSISN